MSFLKERSGDCKTILFRLALCAMLLAVFLLLGIEDSAHLDISHTDLPVSGLPQALQGLRVAEISDLHSCRYGEGQSELVDAVRAFKPDLILLAGDLIDSVAQDSEPCEELARGLVPIAPVYRVRGNHEYKLPSRSQEDFDARMASCGVILLDNQSVVLSKGGQSYLLTGMDDVQKYQPKPGLSSLEQQQFEMETAKGFMSAIQSGMPEGSYPLKIMLCHEPQFWQLWQEAGYDAALCGHLHGWLVRVPGVGGMLRFEPSLYFPEEDAGLYDKQGLLVYISRGLDDRARLRSIRVNNPPELAFFTLVKSQPG